MHVQYLIKCCCFVISLAYWDESFEWPMKWWNTGSGSGKHSLVRQWRTTKWTPKAGATPVWPTAAKQGAPRRTLLTTLKSWLQCNFVLLKTQLLKVWMLEYGGVASNVFFASFFEICVFWVLWRRGTTMLAQPWLSYIC